MPLMAVLVPMRAVWAMHMAGLVVFVFMPVIVCTVRTVGAMRMPALCVSARFGLKTLFNGLNLQAHGLHHLGQHVVGLYF